MTCSNTWTSRTWEIFPPLIDSKLRTYGFSQTLHRPAINQILQQLMEVELEPGMSLARYPKA